MSTTGRIEVICGPMFAGKTEELLRRVRRAVIAGRRVVVVSHALDTRHGTDRLASHIGIDHPSVAAASSADIRRAVPEGTDIVAIDEAQFFGPDLVTVTTDLADRGINVIVAGLDVTFDGRPFEPLPTLMALAERVDKLTAICTVCGEEAVFHIRVAAGVAGGATAGVAGGAAAGVADGATAGAAPSADVVAEHVGGTDKYQARCRRHFSAEPDSERA